MTASSCCRRCCSSKTCSEAILPTIDLRTLHVQQVLVIILSHQGTWILSFNSSSSRAILVGARGQQLFGTRFSFIKDRALDLSHGNVDDEVDCARSRASLTLEGTMLIKQFPNLWNSGASRVGKQHSGKFVKIVCSKL